MHRMNDALMYAEGFFSILDSEQDVEPSGSYRSEKIPSMLQPAV